MLGSLGRRESEPSKDAVKKRSLGPVCLSLHAVLSSESRHSSDYCQRRATITVSGPSDGNFLSQSQAMFEEEEKVRN